MPWVFKDFWWWWWILNSRLIVPFFFSALWRGHSIYFTLAYFEMRSLQSHGHSTTHPPPLPNTSFLTLAVVIDFLYVTDFQPFVALYVCGGGGEFILLEIH